jgi:exopolyphosphatase/guanosine-5'-triphosphate,3'-diphosphate pyrophosphatase
MYELAAAISIASDGIYLNLSESDGSKIKQLEYLYQPLNVGSDAFNQGRISLKKVDKICKILNDYKQILREYKVKKVRVVSTTALREASNIVFILDQIKSRTRFTVEVLDDPQEKSFIYRAMLLKLKNTTYKDKLLFLGYIGTGSLGLAICKEQKIIYSQNIRIGSVKLTELLRNYQGDPENAHIVIGEYLSSFVKSIQTIPKINRVEHFITCGQEIESIIQLCGGNPKKEIEEIDIKMINKLFEEIKTDTTEQLSHKFNLPEHHLDVLLPSIGIYKMLFDIVDVNPINSVSVMLTDALLLEMFSLEEYRILTEIFQQSTVISAKNLGKRFLFDEEHANQVEKLSLKLFDGLKSKHRLGSRERLLLQLSSVLHDVGKFIQLKNHSEHSANIIRGTELPGLTKRETDIVASVAEYHSKHFLLSEDVEMMKMDQRDRLIIAKLLALLRLADALDRSHSSKVKDIKIQIKGRKMKLRIIANKKLMLEKWSIETKSEFFEDIFGLKPEILKG